jgi:glycosyltransferase involved in cell wall biosynthesis
VNTIPELPMPRPTETPHALPRLDNVRVLVLFGGTRLFGQERGNIEALRNLAAMGAKVRVVTTSRDNASEVQKELTRQGLEWITAPFGYTWHNYLLGREFHLVFLNLYSIVKVSWRVFKEARQWKPTHLFTMNWQYFIYAYPALFLLNLPLIWRSGDQPPKHSRMHRWLAHRICKRVDLMVCNSQFIKGQWETIGMSTAKIQVIYNYPPDRLQQAKPELPDLPAGALVVTFIGQVSKHKGILVLLEAVASLVADGHNLVLWVVGDQAFDTGFFEEAKRKVAILALQGRVVFFGFISNVVPILERTDLHVCPSLVPEPLANVVSEAKQCGKPSVVFPMGGLPELIQHQVDGYICRDCSAEALVEGIGFFLDRPDERRHAGEAARNSLEVKFGLERFRKQWAAVFLKLND